MWTQGQIGGRIFRVDACGVVEELLDIPLALLEPSEESQDPGKVERYAQAYRAGSPFPPVSVMGITSTARTYRITNGHHRWQAARLVCARNLYAWSSWYVEYHRDCCGQSFPSLARVSETTWGRELARKLGIGWCTHCGSSLNVLVPGDRAALCRSCEIARANGHWQSPNEFEEWSRQLDEEEGNNLSKLVCVTKEIWFARGN